MAESPDAPRDTTPEGLSLVRLARYGVSLTPSEELNEVVTSFLNEKAKRKVGNRILRLGVAQKLINIQSDGRERSEKMTSSIDDYSRSIRAYERGRQFRIQTDGFIYTQERSSRGATTTLLLNIATSQAMRNDIMKPPFFEPGTSGPLQARIVFPSEDVVPFADQHAQEVGSAFTAEHLSAKDGLAQFAFYLFELQVTRRELLPARALRVVKPD